MINQSIVGGSSFLFVGSVWCDSRTDFLPTFVFFLNYQQHKVGISANYFFPFISMVRFIVVAHKFGGKCYLIFKLIIMNKNNWYVKIWKENTI